MIIDSDTQMEITQKTCNLFLEYQTESPIQNFALGVCILGAAMGIMEANAEDKYCLEVITNILQKYETRQ